MIIIITASTKEVAVASRGCLRKGVVNYPVSLSPNSSPGMEFDPNSPFGDLLFFYGGNKAENLRARPGLPELNILQPRFNLSVLNLT